MDESLEVVQLELALHSQNLISLGFEESIQAALKVIGGGEMLFQMRLEREDCQRIAAVRIGSGEEQQFALVIMPPGGGLMRVEPVDQSSNPLAPIIESYARLKDTFLAAPALGIDSNSAPASVAPTDPTPPVSSDHAPPSVNLKSRKARTTN